MAKRTTFTERAKSLLKEERQRLQVLQSKAADRGDKAAEAKYRARAEKASANLKRVYDRRPKRKSGGGSMSGS